MATLTPALVMGLDKDAAPLPPEKLANMILIEGDSTKNRGDIRKIATVLKGGTVYTPAAIEGARHRAATTRGPGPPSIIEAIPRQLPMRRARVIGNVKESLGIHRLRSSGQNP